MGSSPVAIVFIGPSLPRDWTAPLGLSLELRPPIRRGDLLKINPEETRCVGIVDGEFDQSLAVAPREIQGLLRRGVVCFGSSSMGALRAVDLRFEGMRGVGEVYRMYESEEVASEDEVALLINPDTMRAITEPLVNIRAAVRVRLADGSLTAAQADAILKAAQSLRYTDRSYGKILRDAGAALGEDLLGLKPLLAQHDQKILDADALLKAVAEFVASLKIEDA